MAQATWEILSRTEDQDTEDPMGCIDPVSGSKSFSHFFLSQEDGVPSSSELCLILPSVPNGRDTRQRCKSSKQNYISSSLSGHLLSLRTCADRAFRHICILPKVEIFSTCRCYQLLLLVSIGGASIFVLGSFSHRAGSVLPQLLVSRYEVTCL